MTAPEDPHGSPIGPQQPGPSPPERRSALSFLLAAIPLLLVVTSQYGVQGTLLRFAPLLLFGGVYLLLPRQVQHRPWGLWMLLVGGVGGLVVALFVLELR